MNENASDHGGNLCTINADGPLHLTGRIRVELPGGKVENTNEAFLCRCGASRTKPYCDDAHHSAGFADTGVIQGGRLAPGEGGDPSGGGDAATDDPVTIVCAINGPLLVRGPLTVVAADGVTSRGRKGALCRCGESSAKPFCDGSHKECGFTG